MQIERITPGCPLPRPIAGLLGAVLTRDLVLDGRRVAKGTRLSAEDLASIEGARGGGESVTVLRPDPWEVHEDEAAVRLAAAVAGGDPGVTIHGPTQSRVDLVATAAGVVEIRLAALERLNRLDPLEVFTVHDGRIVAPGDLVASIKIGPHLVESAVLAAGEAVATRGGPLARVRPFRPVRIAVLVKERVTGAARERFEASVQARIAGLGAVPAGLVHVADEAAAVTQALRAAISRPTSARIVLTVGGASTDPADPFFVAVEALGGRIVRHGLPSHPGSMVWLGRIGRTAVVGLPGCGASSRATAADLLLSRLVAGQPATAATVARLAHGGILDRDQRFRFPAYARTTNTRDGADDDDGLSAANSRGE